MVKKIIIGYVIIFVVIICYLLLSFGKPIIGVHEHWDNFVQSLTRMYPFIDEVHIGGAGPTANINIKLEKKVEPEQIENIFNYVVSQPPEVFDDVRVMHKQNHGDLTKLSIDIYTDETDKETIYRFSSKAINEEELGFSKFKDWTLEHGGIAKTLIVP